MLLISWVAVSQAPASCSTSSGDRRLVLPERGLRRAPPGEISLLERGGGHRLVIQQGRDQGAGLRDLPAIRSGRHSDLPADPDREPVLFPPDGAFSQLSRDQSGSQPWPGPSSDGSAIPSRARAITCSRASSIAVIRPWPDTEVPDRSWPGRDSFRPRFLDVVDNHRRRPRGRVSSLLRAASVTAEYVTLVLKRRYKYHISAYTSCRAFWQWSNLPACRG
jgi:hypothetical protein